MCFLARVEMWDVTAAVPAKFGPETFGLKAEVGHDFLLASFRADALNASGTLALQSLRLAHLDYLNILPNEK